MCLHAYEKVLKSVKDRLAKNGFVLGYKVVEISYGNVSSVCYGHVWKSGWNASDIHTNGIENAAESKTSDVHGGIHVYLNRPSQNCLSFSRRILPVLCFENDLIAAGKNPGDAYGAVFSKVFVKNSDFAKIVPMKTSPKKKK